MRRRKKKNNVSKRKKHDASTFQVQMEKDEGDNTRQSCVTVYISSSDMIIDKVTQFAQVLEAHQVSTSNALKVIMLNLI